MEAVERRKSERQRVFQPPMEVKPQSATGGGMAAASTNSDHADRRGHTDDIDVTAIKKKVSKALKKVWCMHFIEMVLLSMSLSSRKDELLLDILTSFIYHMSIFPQLIILQ